MCQFNLDLVTTDSGGSSEPQRIAQVSTPEDVQNVLEVLQVINRYSLPGVQTSVSAYFRPAEPDSPNEVLVEISNEFNI